jgi:hypothetical protein
MKRSLILLSVYVMLAQVSSLAAAPLKRDQVRWAQQVRLFYRTHGFTDATKEEQKKAETALLGEGRRRAEIELGRLLRERSLSDPLCFQVAYTMALLDLDYKASRDVLLKYLRAFDPNRKQKLVDWDLLMRTEADPDDKSIIVAPEDVAGHVFDIYDQRKDPVLLSALLNVAPYADGCLAEGMSEDLARIAKENPSALLRELSGKRTTIWRSVCNLVAFEVADKAAKKAFPRLAQIAASNTNPLHLTATRLIRGIAETQERERRARREAEAGPSRPAPALPGPW